MRFMTLMLLILVAPATLAQSLTTERAEDFLESLDGVQEYADTLDEEITASGFEGNILPEAGTDFAPYSRSIDFLREDHPDVHDDMTNLVESHGFDTLEDWAQTGDQVAIAYIAMQMEGTEMGEVTPEMLEQVPAQMRPQIERMLAIVETVRNAPPENIEALRPLATQLAEHMGEIQR